MGEIDAGRVSQQIAERLGCLAGAGRLPCRRARHDGEWLAGRAVGRPVTGLIAAFAIERPVRALAGIAARRRPGSA